jgi:hypothetical protein
MDWVFWQTVHIFPIFFVAIYLQQQQRIQKLNAVIFISVTVICYAQHKNTSKRVPQLSPPQKKFHPIKLYLLT